MYTQTYTAHMEITITSEYPGDNMLAWLVRLRKENPEFGKIWATLELNED